MGHNTGKNNSGIGRILWKLFLGILKLLAIIFASLLQLAGVIASKFGEGILKMLHHD